ncbi:MAG: chemotaxis protein CheX [Proteobacteria bacterium]|nr:chemotaxis protein CheX [Pseudomonadota bacterium]
MTKIPGGLRTILQDGISEMFRDTDVLNAYKISSHSDSPGVSKTVSYASVLGYSGDKMKGSMVITCERALLDKSHPNHAMGMPVEESDLADWAGEFVNQALGRVKNKLASAGVMFSMSTPTTVTGKSMQITAPKEGYAHQIIFAGEYGPISVNFLCVIEPGTTFETKANVSVATEGDSLLF